jgi:hypothetical protein
MRYRRPKGCGELISRGVSMVFRDASGAVIEGRRRGPGVLAKQAIVHGTRADGGGSDQQTIVYGIRRDCHG